MWRAVRYARLVGRWLAHSPLNLARDRRFRREVLGDTAPLADLTRYERQVYSQNGEDGIVEAILARVGTVHRVCAEIGVGDGTECNTRLLRERHGWRGVAWDAAGAVPARGVRAATVQPENVNALLESADLPPDLDLLSIDIDGNDLWVWDALAPKWRPRVVIMEYNASAGPTASVAMPFDPAHAWDRTTYFGASLQALVAVGRRKGYVLVACDSTGVNAFFVRADLLPALGPPLPPELLWRPPSYGRHLAGHPASARPLAPFLPTSRATP